MYSNQLKSNPVLPIDMKSLPYTTRLKGIQESIQTYNKEINKFKKDLQSWSKEIDQLENKEINKSFVSSLTL